MRCVWRLRRLGLARAHVIGRRAVGAATPSWHVTMVPQAGHTQLLGPFQFGPSRDAQLTRRPVSKALANRLRAACSSSAAAEWRVQLSHSPFPAMRMRFADVDHGASLLRMITSTQRHPACTLPARAPPTAAPAAAATLPRHVHPLGVFVFLRSCDQHQLRRPSCTTGGARSPVSRCSQAATPSSPWVNPSRPAATLRRLRDGGRRAVPPA